MMVFNLRFKAVVFLGLVLGGLSFVGSHVMTTPVAASDSFTEGEPALVVLTASWCAKCRELPDILDPTLEFYESHALRVVTLDVDNPATTEVADRYGISLNGNDVPQIYFYANNRTQLVLGANEHRIGHPEDSQAQLEARLAPLLGQ